jgi:hypothetical protein
VRRRLIASNRTFFRNLPWRVARGFVARTVLSPVLCLLQ